MLVGYGPSVAPPSRRRRNGSGHRERTGRRPAGPRTDAPAAPTAPARPLAAPPVRFMARQNGIDLADVTGHGPGGVITREDLAAHIERRLRPNRRPLRRPTERPERPSAASRSTWPRP